MRARAPALLVALLAAVSVACSEDARPIEQTDDEVAGVPQTEVERQAIGSVWLYAYGEWASALHASATGETLDASPAYLAYWHWFDQIASGVSPHIQTGGNWTLASSLVRRYGLCPASAFPSESAPADDAERFAEAMATIEASLASGVLHDPAKRRDRTVVRSELDRAFRLPSDTRAMLDRAFGADASRSFTSLRAPADASGTPLVRAETVRVSYPGSTSGGATLATAMTAWRPLYYVASDGRAFLQRVQRAMNDGAPILLTWFVDFAALEARDVPLRGSFNLATWRELGPGQQGGHVALLRAYSAKLPDGAIVSAELMRSAPSSALDPNAEVLSVRVQSEWGAARPERATAPGMPAFVDLHLDYLSAPIKRCVTRDGVTDTTSCPFSQVPLESVVLPPGY